MTKGSMMSVKREAVGSNPDRSVTKEELAVALNGREYPGEPAKAECEAAKAAGLVIIFGASDDLVEFRGAVYDEIDACGGTEFRIDSLGLVPSWENLDRDDEDEAEAYFKRKALPSYEIAAIWDRDGYSWVFDTAAPHATFDVMEDGETYCRGIVIELPGAADAPR